MPGAEDTSRRTAFTYNMRSFERFGSLVRYIGYTESRESWCARQVTPDQTIQLPESGHQPSLSRRSVPRIWPWCKEGHQCEGTRGGEFSLNALPSEFHRYQLLESLHGPGFTAMPFSHTIQMGAGAAVSRCRLNSMAWPMPWGAVVVSFSRLTSVF